ncbi:hypothetical protein HY478_01985 [Candidatus Uhrbacteria bacterium]|nr:hypothetical protein [Candidatus Uhrbacteria bacterium]
MIRMEGYRTADGGLLVPYDNAEEYFAAHLEAAELLDEAAPRITLPTDGSRLEVVLDFGRPLGPASMVETVIVNPDTLTTFARRPKRNGPSRVVVLEGDPPQISTFVVVGKPLGPGQYRLVTAYVGTTAPGEPWAEKDVHARDERSLPFWCGHALVWRPDMGEVFTSTWRNELAKLGV